MHVASGVFLLGVFAWVFLRISAYCLGYLIGVFDRVFLRISADFFKYAAKLPSLRPKHTNWEVCATGDCNVDLRRKDLLLNAHHLLSNWRYSKA